MNSRSYFNERAHEWDTYMPSEERARLDALVDAFGLAKGAKVLDVGAGTGIMIPYISARIGESGKVVAVDCAEKMMIRAARKYPGGQYGYCAADIHAMPLREAWFDTVLCFNCFPHFDDKMQALVIMKSLLVPGGEVIVAHSASREYINALHNEIDDVVKDDRIPARANMRQLFEHAGLERISIHEGTDRYCARGRKTG